MHGCCTFYCKRSIVKKNEKICKIQTVEKMTLLDDFCNEKGRPDRSSGRPLAKQLIVAVTNYTVFSVV